MLGRIGDPALLAMGGRLPGQVGEHDLPLQLALLPLALGMVAVAAPTRESVDEDGGSVVVTIVAAVVALGATFLPGLAPGILALGALIMAGLALRARGAALVREGEQVGRALGPLLWTFGSVSLVVLATAGGGPELAAQGLEEVQEQLRPVMFPLFGAGAALLSALFGGEAAGLLGTAFVDRALSLRIEQLPAAIAVGCAAGGLGPLAVAGGLRAGLWRWAVQVVLAIAWCAVVLSLH